MHSHRWVIHNDYKGTSSPPGRGSLPPFLILMIIKESSWCEHIKETQRVTVSPPLNSLASSAGRLTKINVIRKVRSLTLEAHWQATEMKGDPCRNAAPSLTQELCLFLSGRQLAIRSPQLAILARIPSFSSTLLKPEGGAIYSNASRTAIFNWCVPRILKSCNT